MTSRWFTVIETCDVTPTKGLTRWLMVRGHEMNATLFQLVGNDRPINRLRIAAAHIEVAIAHINNEAQARISCRPGSDQREVDSLRLLVCALADIRSELTGSQHHS
jgi:hypothetical protein